MTFMPTIAIRIVNTDPPFFPFLAWSVLIHIVIITLSSFIHFVDKIEHTNSTVQVTLIEAISPIHKPQTTNSKPIESATKPPPLIKARRPIHPIPQKIMQTSQALLKTPAVRTTLTQITHTMAVGATAHVPNPATMLPLHFLG